MKMLVRWALALTAVFIATPSMATSAAAQKLPPCTVYTTINGTVPCTGVVPVDSSTGTPIRWQDLMATKMVAAESTPVSGDVTSTTVSPSSGTATFSNGYAYIGPFQPQLNREIRIILKGTWTGTIYVGTASAQGGCSATSVNPLTISGSVWASYTGNANEVVDLPTLGTVGTTAAPVYCLVAQITSGTATYILRQ